MSGPDKAEAAAERPTETPEEKKARKESEKKIKAEQKARREAEKAAREAQRGQKAAVLTAPDPSDPHGCHYGDAEVIRSQCRTDTVWTKVTDLNMDGAGKKVQSRTVTHDPNDCTKNLTNDNTAASFTCSTLPGYDVLC